MGMYSALSRASITIELFDDNEQYTAIVSSTNGTILQPYDLSTTLIGSVMKNNIDVTNKIEDLRWTKWNPSTDNLEECVDWGKDKRGQSSIIVEKDDVDSKSIFVFEAYDNKGKLLCSNSISIIDINDLLVSTKEPEDPYVGQVWVDDSVDPANLCVWNGYKWLVTGAIGVIVKNLFHNSGFSYNHDNWTIVGEQSFMFTPTPHDYLNHRFLRLNSTTLVDVRRGIAQTTTDDIVQNSEYSVQMLCYSKEDSQTYSKLINLYIYSINESGVETLIEHCEYILNDQLQSIFYCFNSLNDTVSLRVEITGENGKRFDFSIAEPSLYNTHNKYPWTMHPADNAEILTQENVWNALSNHGTVQGIMSAINPETGQMDYYINASMIGAGKVAAQYLDVYNLSVYRKDNPDIKTLEITDDGYINLTVKELKIGIEEQKIEEYIVEESDILRSDLEDSIAQTKDVLSGEIGQVKSDLGDDISQTKSDLSGEISQAKSDLSGEINSKYSELSASIDSISANVSDGNTQHSSLVLTVNSISERVTNTEKDTASLFDITDNGIYLSSSQGGNQSLVDINNNEISIKSNNITLEGYTTINEGFHIDNTGTMHANEGVFSGTITASIIQSDNTDNPRFKLTRDGTLLAKNAIITGDVGGLIPSGDIFGSQNGKFMVSDDGILYTEEGTIYKAEIDQSDLLDCKIYNSKNTLHINSSGDIFANTLSCAQEAFTVSQYGDIIANSLIVSNSIKNSRIMNGSMNGAELEECNIFTCDIDQSTITSSDIKKSGTETIIDKDGNVTATSLTIQDKKLDIETLTCTDSIKTSVMKNASDQIIFDSESNTFIATHFNKGEKCIGEFTEADGIKTYKLGDVIILCGSIELTEVPAATTASVDITFDTEMVTVPSVSLSVLSEDPMIYTSISQPTNTGFTLYYHSLSATAFSINWTAIGTY